jgi:hypothetical protein
MVVIKNFETIYVTLAKICKLFFFLIIQSHFMKVPFLLRTPYRLSQRQHGQSRVNSLRLDEQTRRLMIPVLCLMAHDTYAVPEGS